MVAENKNNLFGDTTGYPTSGLAGAYRYYMDQRIQIQINWAPKYLTQIWTDYVKQDIFGAYNLPEVNPAGAAFDQTALDDWNTWIDWLNEHEAHYKSGDSYSWGYNFVFTWDTSAVVHRQSLYELLKMDDTCSSTVSTDPSTTTTSEESSSTSTASCTSWSVVIVATPDDQGNAGMVETVCVDSSLASSTEAMTTTPSTTIAACLSVTTITIVEPDEMGNAGMVETSCLDSTSTTPIPEATATEVAPSTTTESLTPTETEAPTPTGPIVPTYTAPDGTTQRASYEFWIHTLQAANPVIGASPPTFSSTLCGFETPYDNNWDLCNTQEADKATVEQTTMPEGIADIHVFGDVCVYAETSEFSSADTGDVVGRLQCERFAEASCWKFGTEHVEVCSAGTVSSTYTPLVKCDWE